MTPATDTDPAEQDSLAKSHGNAAAAIVSQLNGNTDGQPRARRPVEGLENDENANGRPAEKEFVSSKGSRIAKRKWAAAQQDRGNLPKSAPSQPFGMRAILLLTSTLGVLLFGYRMYLTYWQSNGQSFFIYTPEQLAKHGSSNKSIWIAIAGEVYDVSSARQYYGAEGGYDFFAGRDASRAYLTGKFKDDLNDDVADFTDEQFHGLMHWKDFYLKEYKYKGRVVGSFFDEHGFPTALSRHMWEASARHEAALEERKNKRLAYPDCSSRWSSSKGSEVWCNDGMYPRLLTEMVAGKAEQRCACFKERGFSNLRRMYPGCKPDDTRCELTPEVKAELQAANSQKQAADPHGAEL